MASVSMSGYLRDPLGEFSDKDKILFKHQTTTGTVLAGSVSVFDVDETGYYDIEVGYGNVQIMSRNRYDCRWYSHGVFTINSDTTADNLPTLLNATVPLSDSEILEVESLLQDAADYASAAEAAQTAAEAAQSATEALFDAGFDSNVATSVGLAATPYPDLHIPFNDGLRIESGYGTNDQIDVSAAQDGSVMVDLPSRSVDFTRSSTSTVINKSGVPTDLSADEAGVGSNGIWLHGSYSNSVLYSDDISTSNGWSVLAPSTTTITDLQPDPSGGGGAAMIYTDGSDVGGIFRVGVLSGSGDVNVSVWLKGSSGGEVVSLGTSVRSLVTITDEWKRYNVVVDSGSGDLTCYSTSEQTFYCWGFQAVESTTILLPYLRTGSTASTATATTCTVPVENNMPVAGESFSVSIFGGFNNDSVASCLIQVGDSVNGLGLRSNGNFILPSYFDGSSTGVISGGLPVNYTDNKLHVITYDKDTGVMSWYADGDLISSGATTGMSYSGGIYIGSTSLASNHINRQVGGVKIYHTALTAEQVAALGAAE